MKKYKHVTKGTMATMIAPNTLLLDGETEPTKLSDITLKRWWQELEVDETVHSLTMSETIATLEKLFEALNRIYYENSLPKVVITVQTTPKAYGHCSTKKIWTSGIESEAMYEINIGAEYLSREFAEVAATLNHEMVHLYCLENGIQDTCQNGRYHNKTFKEEAVKRDLLIGYNKASGYSPTEATPAFKEKLEQAGFTESIEISRSFKARKASSVRAKPHKYVCPICGQTVKSTAELNLVCGICNEPFVKVN